jgi:hypothetical protein
MPNADQLWSFHIVCDFNPGGTFFDQPKKHGQFYFGQCDMSTKNLKKGLEIGTF